MHTDSPHTLLKYLHITTLTVRTRVYKVIAMHTKLLERVDSTCFTTYRMCDCLINVTYAVKCKRTHIFCTGQIVHVRFSVFLHEYLNKPQTFVAVYNAAIFQLIGNV